MLPAGVPSGKGAFVKPDKHKRSERFSRRALPTIPFKYEPANHTVRDAGQFEVVEYKTRVGVYRFVYKNMQPWVLQAPSVALSSLPAPHNRAQGLYALRNFSRNDPIGFYGGTLHKRREQEYTHALKVPQTFLKACNIVDSDYVVDAENVNPPPFLGSINSSKKLAYKPNVHFKNNGGVYCQQAITGLMTDKSVLPEEIVNLPLQDLEQYELMISYGKEYNISQPSAQTSLPVNWSNWSVVTLPKEQIYAQAQRNKMQVVHSRGNDNGPFSVVVNDCIDIVEIPPEINIQLQLLKNQVYERVCLVCSQEVLNAIKYTHPCLFGYHQLLHNKWVLHKRANPVTSGTILQIDPRGNVRYFVERVCFLQEVVHKDEEIEATVERLSKALGEDVRAEKGDTIYINS